LDTPESRRRLAAELAAAARVHPTAIVHGGGKQMTRFLADRGIESRFVNGLRVSSPEVIDALLKVLAGSVNSELVAALQAEGARAVGLSGLDGGLIQAEKLAPEYEWVGKPVASNGPLLDLLTAYGYLPVIACVGGDLAGGIFNINADQAAVACATGFGAQQLLFLTDVEGVRNAENRIAAQLTKAEARGLIESGVATGGMHAKLESAIAALEAGVEQVVIAPGARPGIIPTLLNRESIGTVLVQ
jgi:acetylglutamate kinase